MRPPCVTQRVYVCTCVSARMCACADVCARTCVRIRRKHHVKEFRYLLIGTLLIYTRICFDFSYVGPFLCFLCAQVTWRCMERRIARFNCDHQYSLK